MKCNCEECRGSGTVVCPECDGTGGAEESIESVKLSHTMPNYGELLELQKDAQRCIAQANRLCDINPSRRETYIEQLGGCLKTINAQADKVAKKKS